MGCAACSGELILTSVIPDRTGVRGCEQHTFICAECHGTEQRVVFVRHGREDASRPVPAECAPPCLPALCVEQGSAAMPGLLRRVMERLRGLQGQRAGRTEGVNTPPSPG